MPGKRNFYFTYSWWVKNTTKLTPRSIRIYSFFWLPIRHLTLNLPRLPPLHPIETGLVISAFNFYFGNDYKIQEKLEAVCMQNGGQTSCISSNWGKRRENLLATLLRLEGSRSNWKWPRFFFLLSFWETAAHPAHPSPQPSFSSSKK